MTSGKEAENKIFSDADKRLTETEQEMTLSSKLFQLVVPATGKDRPTMVDSSTDGTSRRLVRGDWIEQRLGKSAIQTS